jgi:hypothetical protein
MSSLTPAAKRRRASRIHIGGEKLASPGSHFISNAILPIPGLLTGEDSARPLHVAVHEDLQPAPFLGSHIHRGRGGAAE